MICRAVLVFSLAAQAAFADEPASCPPCAPTAVVAPVSHRQPASFYALVDAGYRFLAFDGLYAQGGAPRVGVGGAWRHVALYAHAGFFGGRTDGGLSTYQLQLGMVVEGILDRVRIGGGPHLGNWWVDRVTAPQDPMSTMTLGLWAFFAVDLVRYTGGAFYVQLEGSGDFSFSGPSVNGAGLAVGVRMR